MNEKLERCLKLGPYGQLLHTVLGIRQTMCRHDKRTGDFLPLLSPVGERKIRKIINGALTPIQKELIELAFGIGCQKMTDREIAKKFKTNLGTVKAAKKETMSDLKKESENLRRILLE